MSVVAVANNRKNYVAPCCYPTAALIAVSVGSNAKTLLIEECCGLSYHAQRLGEILESENLAQRWAPLQMRPFLPLLEVRGHGESAKPKSIISAVKILQVLKGHCNCINFRDFINRFIFSNYEEQYGWKKLILWKPHPSNRK